MKKNSLAGYLLCGIALSVMLTACGDEEFAETDVSHEEIVMYELLTLLTKVSIFVFKLG